MIIPISTVSFGFGAGGTQFAAKADTVTPQNPMFGGGCGGGANVKPIAFLVVGGGNVRLLPISDKVTPADRIIDMVPEVIDKVNGALSGAVEKFAAKRDKKKEEKATASGDETQKYVDIAE